MGKILEQGEIKSEEIDSKKLIDQHYYAIASKATILKPNQLNVPEDKFKEKFGLEWKQALENGNVYNALDACAKLEVTPDEMDAQWGICKKTDISSSSVAASTAASSRSRASPRSMPSTASSCRWGISSR